MRTHAQRWLIVSSITMLAALLLIVIVKPLWGIDFTGGSLLEISTAGSADSVEQLLDDQFDLPATIQTTQDNSLLIRTAHLSPERHDEVVAALTEATLLDEELRFESIGPTIGAELRRKAWIAIATAIGVLIVYLAYVFRQSSGLISSWKFGVAAVVALVHDLLVVTALFVILGLLFDARVDALFVTAMLAILGYSVNDTIVLFNRLQQEWLSDRSANLDHVIKQAIKKTLVRSLNTSFTTLLVLVALLVFGGSTIRWFIVALAAGTIAGTYSSLLVAPPFLQLLAGSKTRATG